MKERLDGGRENRIFREGRTVIRPSSRWTPAVHDLLAHLQQVGFDGAPRPLGIDTDGNERVSFIDGEVHSSLVNADARSEEGLRSAAELLRRYHDATVGFLSAETSALPWMLPKREPVEVMCHGDFAPYNLVYKGKAAVGIIDFDTVHPAPRVWDVAYAVYRWAPLVGEQNTEGFGSVAEKIGRAQLFCDAYGLEPAGRDKLGEMVIERLTALIEYMHTQAAGGNETFAAHIRQGHDELYRGDIEFVMRHLDEIREGLAHIG